MLIASSSPTRDQDILYLKWDLQRFLAGKEYDLLPVELIDQIGRLVAQLTVYAHDHDNAADSLDATVMMFKATDREMRRVLTDIAAGEARHDGSVTLRKQLVRGELARALTRMTHVLSLLESNSPRIVT